MILILWWRNFQLEYWRTFQLVSTFYADSRAEGVEFQTILSASRLSDIFFMRLSVASVVFVSGA
ncbi:hypothetical protein [Phocaeicola vulgatus]|uniref:hypothetical protein n=1 Tax=Phocaeicola vulgatus TaxID=821 RepID=UPI0039B60C66